MFFSFLVDACLNLGFVVGNKKWIKKMKRCPT